MNENHLKILELDTEILKEVIENELKELNKRGKGRPKGRKTSKYRYFIEVYDILSKNWMKLGEYHSFADMYEQLKTNYNLNYSPYVLQNIYNNKNREQFLRIFHL